MQKHQRQHQQPTTNTIIKLSEDNHLISQLPSRVSASILSWRLRKVANSKHTKMKRKSLNKRNAMKSKRRIKGKAKQHKLINAFTCVKLQKPPTRNGMEWKSTVFEFKIKRFYRNLLFAACVCVYVWMHEMESGTYALCIQLSHQSHIKAVSKSLGFEYGINLKCTVIFRSSTLKMYSASRVSP